MLADLHIHSTSSDGVYTPFALIEQAQQAHLKAIALTDHDNTEGFEAARDYLQQKDYDLQLISGVEIDTFYDIFTVHVLGYHIDVANKTLQDKLHWTRDGRLRRMEQMVDKINQYGNYHLTMEEVRRQAQGSKSLGRPHIARVMVAKGYFSCVEDVFATLIGKGKPCYCEQEKLTPIEAVKLIKDAGGLACLAHPEEVMNQGVVEELLLQAHFDALEVWHPTAEAAHSFSLWQHVAEKYHLLTGGGSDFHGDPKRYPVALGVFPIEYENVAPIINKLAWR